MIAARDCASSSPPPPKEGNGSPPIFRPPDLSACDEIDFFISRDDVESGDSREELIASDGCRGERGGVRKIACTLVRYLGERPPKEETPRTTNQEAVRTATTCVDQKLPVIVLCHGMRSWRNQMLLSRLSVNLSEDLSCHSLRFDFGGNGHSTGKFRYSGFDGELRDLKRVVKFVEEEMGCRVCCVLGHSKAGPTVLRYARERQDALDVKEGVLAGDGQVQSHSIPCFVNLSSMYYLPNKWSPEARFTQAQLLKLKIHGQFSLEPSSVKELIVTQADIEERVNLDLSFVKGIVLPVLTIHGEADEAVDVENAKEFDASIPRHELCIIAGANHNFSGLKYMGSLVGTVSHFIRKHCGGLLRHSTRRRQQTVKM